jgi:beta-galactosidase
MLTAPEVNWKLGNQVLKLNPNEVKVPAGKEITIILEKKVSNQLKYWDFNHPNLYGMTVSLEQGEKLIDKKYERFGWREFKIEGKKFLLNGKSVQLLGDSQHLLNETYLSRRFAWSWFKLMKNVGANAARLHAMVWPGFIHDMADEMGIALLSESSIYASMCNIDYDSDLFWKSAKYNVEGMVRKYRNHPGVYGWSIENEVFPALNVKCNDTTYKKMVYDGMNGLADICRRLDPTRDWISGDGSRDMDGRLPVFNVHYGSTISYKEDAANTNKPFGVGEASIAYYATPRQSEMYVGDRAYRSYKDHSDAIAIDAYELLKVQRQICTYCSVWNLGYYAVEELPMGMSDLSKLPVKDEGVFFTANYVEGKPGTQIERIPPYSTKYNPGYDPGMPLYKPLPMYYAIKAAYNQPAPVSCEWDHRQVFKTPVAPVIENPEKEVLFA